MTVDRHLLTSEASEAEDVPCSSQNINGRIIVSACQKRGGNRVYDKRHYCLYCCKPYAKMARHLEKAHENKSDVAKALSFPKGSKERRKQLDYIRNRGNFAHNAAVMESGKGELVPFKRPSKETQGNDFMHCAYCQALFTRKVLWRHMRNCRLSPRSVAPKPGKNRVQSMCTYTGPVPSHISKQLWGVISAMNPDPITDIIKNDQVVTDIGQHLLNKGGTSAKNQQCVREKMREMGRLIHNARRVTTLKKMEDLINPKKYMETVKAVKATCGYDSETNKFLIPSLANKLGHALVKASKLLKAQGLMSNNKELVKNSNSSAEETFHHTDRNEMPPQPSKRREPPQPSKRREPPRPSKRREPPSSEDEISSGVSAVKPSSKGKGPLKKKKTPWQQTEVQAVERHMNRFITSCVVPGKSDCERCLNAEPEALKNRDWQNLKFYVYNRITAYKRKFQCE
ncbi:hypothetical protein GBF38_000001 [Nibea albiflora]|nr:hypothetical protein GBF38_000001 [Nibea albiflora]